METIKILKMFFEAETFSLRSRDRSADRSVPALRCHVCGFETDSRALFQSHMTEHRQWERGSFSLHCCVCDHSTNQEAEMRAHANTHMQGIMGVSAEMRCVTETVNLCLTVKLWTEI